MSHFICQEYARVRFCVLCALPNASAQDAQDIKCIYASIIKLFLNNTADFCIICFCLIQLGGKEKAAKTTAKSNLAFGGGSSQGSTNNNGNENCVKYNTSEVPGTQKSILMSKANLCKMYLTL